VAGFCEQGNSRGISWLGERLLTCDYFVTYGEKCEGCGGITLTACQQ
jgi:hypothetical protein